MRRTFLLAGLVLALGLASGQASADELTIYAMPSAHGLRWDSPRALLKSRLANELTWPRKSSQKRKMGHVMVELKTSSGVHILTGMATAPGAVPASKLLTQGKIGLGILNYSFKGRMETKAELEPELVNRYKRGAISFARFELSPETGKRLAKYVAEYKERGYYKQYGGSNRPLHGEGGGCSAFGVSFLELAGVLTPEMKKAWSRNLALPKKLVGSGGNKVSIDKLLLGKGGGRWARPGEPQQAFSIYDPQLIHEWILGKTRSKTSRFGKLAAKTERRGKARGLYVDARQVRTPQKAIWKGEASRYRTRSTARRMRTARYKLGKGKRVRRSSRRARPQRLATQSRRRTARRAR